MIQFLRQRWHILREFPFFIFGFVAAFLDGVAIAQCHDWITSGHRMSIWVLM